jgi:hypothetical protein
MPSAFASGFWYTSSSMPDSRAMRSRKLYMSRNFQVVSTCSSGNGGGAGKKALRARCSITALSLPMEYSITGLSASATTSRMMWMLSASRRCRWVSVTGVSGAGMGSGAGAGWSARWGGSIADGQVVMGRAGGARCRLVHRDGRRGEQCAFDTTGHAVK